MSSARLALAIALTCAAACARPPERPNVLLIVVDTLRADRLSCAGYERETTPSIDILAAEGLRFTHAQSPRAKTTPAVATLLTGLYPHDHGVRDLTMPLDAQVPLITEHLRAAGWSTAAIIGNFVLQDTLSGFARGFDVWIEELPDLRGVPPDDVPQRTARSMTDAALSALGLASPGLSFVKAERPWFLWLHYMDPHGVYDPPDEHRIFASASPDPIPAAPEARAGAIRKQWVAEYNVLPADRLEDGRVNAAAVRDRYDAEVRYTDAEIGRLLSELNSAGMLEKTIVILVADHGESLGEHDYWFEHGRYVYEATCRVPLVIWFGPGLRDRPAPGVIEGDVSLADLAPTLCDLLGVAPFPARSAGASQGPRGSAFTSLFLRDVPGARAVFSEKVERAEKSGAIQAKAVRLGDWKFIRRYTHLPDPRDPTRREVLVLSEELYDLSKDPREEHNLALEPPAAAPLDRLRAELLSFASADVQFEDLARILQERREEIGRDDPQTLRLLESLGY